MYNIVSYIYCFTDTIVFKIWNTARTECMSIPVTKVLPVFHICVHYNYIFLTFIKDKTYCMQPENDIDRGRKKTEKRKF